MTALRHEDSIGRQTVAEPAFAPWQRPVEPTVEMRGLQGSIEAADEFARECGDVRGRPVVVDCRRLRFVSQTFGDRFLARVLREGGASRVELVCPEPRVWDQMVACVEAAGLADRVDFCGAGRILKL